MKNVCLQDIADVLAANCTSGSEMDLLLRAVASLIKDEAADTIDKMHQLMER